MARRGNSAPSEIWSKNRGYDGFAEGKGARDSGGQNWEPGVTALNGWALRAAPRLSA